MDPLLQRWLTFVPLLILLAWAAVVDARTRKIRNWLTVSLVVSGLLQSFGLLGAARTVSPGMSALGILAGFSLPFVLFAIGALGGGDVKLMAGIGAWLGPWPVLLVFAAEAVIGMCIVLTQAAWSGKLRLLLRNTAVVTVNLLHVSDVGVDHVRKTGEGCRSIDRPLPFAVPTLFATLFVLYFGIR